MQALGPSGEECVGETFFFNTGLFTYNASEIAASLALVPSEPTATEAVFRAAWTPDLTPLRLALNATVEVVYFTRANRAESAARPMRDGGFYVTTRYASALEAWDSAGYILRVPGCDVSTVNRTLLSMAGLPGAAVWTRDVLCWPPAGQPASPKPQEGGGGIGSGAIAGIVAGGLVVLLIVMFLCFRWRAEEPAKVGARRRRLVLR